MIIIYSEVECRLYDAFSLKDKRSILKRMMNRIKKDQNVAITELDFYDLWQRTKIGIVTISNERVHAEQTIQNVLRIIDSFPELERTVTHTERI